MLIFLDIDGVMIPAKGWKSPEFLDDGFPAFSKRSTIAIQHLISGDVTVMLTSSHKSKFTIDQWKRIFRKRGINIIRIRSLPENINNYSRKDELVNWFDLNAINEDFLIIDDDKSLNDLPDFLKKKLIQTSPMIGLTEEHLEKARSILD